MSMNKSQANSLRKIARGVASRLDNAHLELCGILYSTYYGEMNDGKAIWLSWGFKSWEDYVERELGIHQRYARELRRVWELFEVDLKSVKKQPYPLSISRLLLLLRVKPTKESVNEWLKKADRMSVCELKHEVMGRDPGIAVFSVTLDQHDKDRVLAAIDNAKLKYKTQSRGAALAKLCNDWRLKNKQPKRKKTG